MTQPIYVVMVNDRHVDPDAEVFTDQDAAVGYARGLAQEYARHPDDFEEKHIDGWLFYATYSVESDSVWVIQKELRT